jgi:spore cortex protein
MKTNLRWKAIKEHSSLLAKGVSRLNQKFLVVPIAALLGLGLAGCGMGGDGGNEASEAGRRSESLGAGTDQRENDNPSSPLAGYDKNFYQHDNRFSRSDANYHGHLDENTREARRSYYTAYEGELTDKIGDETAAIRNVEDVRSVVYGSDVLIAVDLADYSKEEQTKQDIQQAVSPYLRGRSCTVVTDEGTFSRIRNIDNDLRDGGPREQVDLDIKDMFHSLRHRLNGGDR